MSGDTHQPFAALQPAPPTQHLTTLMMQITELRMQVDGVSKSVSDVGEVLRQIVPMDKSISELIIHSQGFSKQLNTVWEKLDEVHAWRTTKDAEASEQFRKLMAYVDAKTAEASQAAAPKFAAASSAAADAASAAAEANAAIKSIHDKATAVRWVMGVAVLLFGGVTTSGALWLVSTVLESKERMAVVEYRISHNKEYKQ